jgi:hypothetical protein
MTTDTTTTTTTTTNAKPSKPSAVPTAKVFAGYVDELMAAGSAVEKAAAKIALAATRQAAHRSSLTYLNAAYAAFKTCHVSCTAQLTKYALGVLGGLAADDKGNPMIARSKSVLRVTDAQERKVNGGDAFTWAVEPKTAQAKEELARARRALAHPDFSDFLTAPTASAKYVREDGLTASERELLALLNWARRNNKASTAKRAGERGYTELQNALKAVKAMFKEFED